ncbi:predicted protein [Aspergillus nidulans FGSC A4]|uniref:PH domain-containing protein n=1 Tax=Emericella nidulans (strain FGSC A4 / ATCC 38163 / CBS 112.46 / NRRL 194 / M139) TaxID=227321 RepID=Q5B996_EMENI|nr:hypothetical protein [Aspergillus nidulans FGSC A4]EAA63455.1 predicted protein [Aspergillus nidulans FGSC A4]CBF83813.1 TPA: conserved hypothetical protein [Aspergillus nidulans FGSC A4]|eukprot:XP_660488.1 predicted protein [Aspergillus nidulans FGSC A4]
MVLSDVAGVAEEVAAGFRRFRDFLPEHSTEITGLIADLFTISTFLKTLEELSRHHHHGAIFNVARSDVDLVSDSLQYTLDDIVEFFGDLDGRRGLTSRSAYKRAWAGMSQFFMDESGETLSRRLTNYKGFLRELEDLIKEAGPDYLFMSRLREQFQELLVKQDGHLARRLGALSVSSSSSSSNSTAPNSPMGDRKPRTRRSYERARPVHLSPVPTSPSSGSFLDIPLPRAPAVPSSPVTSSAASHSLGSNIANEHWAAQVFFQPRTETRLPARGDRCICYGDPQPDLFEWLDAEDFTKLLELSFGGNFRVLFYVRDDDHRARIVCGQSGDYYCLPLNLLEINRRGPSCLNLCRRRRSGSELVVWANLKFSTIEMMVLFFCTFLALRSQDSGRPVSQIRDYELFHEQELFASDTVTGAVRLQASVHKGEMKRCATRAFPEILRANNDRSPVWTTFITDLVRTPRWLRIVERDPKFIILRELSQTIFTFPDYTPPKTHKGGHLLKFMNREDAEGFIHIMAELADGRI